ncbi:MAG: agmatinase [Thermovirgaceae bacterium]|nr:agmatinase [Thermovirgaceae bacterium]
MKGFLASRPFPRDVGWIIQGLPLDMTVSRLHGTASGPEAIRVESNKLENFSFSLEKDLRDISFCDIGDLALPKDDLNMALEMIESVSRNFFDKGKRIASFGGEHLVTLPVVKAASNHYADLAVIHIDAHADLRDIYHGMKNNHATVMRRIAEDCLSTPKSLFQFGIRSGTREELEWGRANTFLFPDRLIEPLRESIKIIGKRPVYLSLDIDAFDPGIAPGTGTPEPCGLGNRDFFESLALMKDMHVIGFDIVEVSPPHDVNNITAVLAAKIARECLITWGGGNC